MSAKRSNDIDWLMVVGYLLLVAVGWLAVYTAGYDEAGPDVLSLDTNYGKQLVWLGVAFVVILVTQILDTRFYTAFAYIIYGLFILALVLVLVLGSTISGSRSWFSLGFMRFQPAEFAKFATCLALAKYVGSLNTGLAERGKLPVAVAIIALPATLILLQGDAGSAVVFSSLILVLYREGLSGFFLLAGVMLVLLFLASLLLPFYVVMGLLAAVFLVLLLIKEKFSPWDAAVFLLPALAAVFLADYVEPKLFIGLLVLGAALGFALFFNDTRRLVYLMVGFLLACSVYVKSVDYVYNNVLKPHQQNRIGVVLGMVEDKQGVGYNLNQSKIAIGSGGVWGKGFLQGTQNKGKFVPELSTDFIFCTIGEELGFVGSAGLIILYLLLLLRIVNVAERQKSKFSRIYGYGVASILFFHFLVNIGMTIGLVPVIGIPLPFISYGGSSLLGFTLLLFIFVKLDSERMMYLR